MQSYLTDFRQALEPYRGSLVKVAHVDHSNAKEYMSALAREDAIERVAWGWYYVPVGEPPASALDFLGRDCNFKVVTGQTAASVWNGDFVHRDVVTVTVEDPSYARALEAFCSERGWRVAVEVDEAARQIETQKVGGVLVEERGPAIVDCMKRWAFVDAVATMSVSRDVPWQRLADEHYFERVSGTDVRVGQAVKYVGHRLFGEGRQVHIPDEYVREELDEAVEKVRKFAIELMERREVGISKALSKGLQHRCIDDVSVRTG